MNKNQRIQWEVAHAPEDELPIDDLLGVAVVNALQCLYASGGKLTADQVDGRNRRIGSGVYLVKQRGGLMVCTMSICRDSWSHYCRVIVDTGGSYVYANFSPENGPLVSQRIGEVFNEQ